MPKSYQYKAFISYSHADKKWGDWLHKKLETYQIPKQIIGNKSEFYDKIPSRLFPIFRDREELATSSELGKQINEALELSSHLIVICSPRAANSQWVNQEILEFKRMGKANRILCLIVDGEPYGANKPELGLEECFPLAIKFKLGSDGNISTSPTEPIAGDAREGKDGKENGLLKLIAGLLGVGFDQLKQCELIRKRNQMIVLNSILFVLLAIVSTLAIWAFSERSESEKQKNLAFTSKLAAEKARDQAILQKKRAEEANEQVLRENYFNNIFLADLKIKQGDTQGAEKLLWATRPKDRHWEWGYLLANADPAMITYKNSGRQILHLLFSDDGQSLITHEAGGIARIMSLDKNQTAREIRFEGWDWFRAPAFAGRRKLVASLGGTNSQFRIWNYETEKTISEPDGDKHHQGRIMATAFESNMETIISGDSSGKLVFWRVRDGRMQKSYKLENASINSLFYMPHQKSILIGDLAGSLRILNADEHNQQLKEVGKIQLASSSAGESINGVIADLSEDRILCWGHNRIWSIDPKKNQVVSTFSTYPVNIARVTFIQNHQYAIAYRNGTVEIRNKDSNQMIRQNKIHPSGIDALASQPRRNLFASSAKNGDLKIFHTEGSLRNTQKSYRISGTRSQGKGDADVAEKQGQVMVTLKDRISLFDIKTGKHLRDISNLQGRRNLSFLHASFSPDGKHVIFTTNDGKVTILEAHSGKIILTLPNQEKETKEAMFFPSGNEILTTSFGKNENLKVWTFPSGVLRRNHVFKEKMQTDQWNGEASISKNAEFISIIGSDGTAKVHRSQDLTLINQKLLFSRFRPEQSYIFDLNHNGSLACIRTEEGPSFLQLWNLQKGEVEMKYFGHSNQVLSSDISRDSRRIISTSRDANLKIWHLESGREILSLSNLERMRGAKFCFSDKNVLVTHDWGGALLIHAYDWQKVDIKKYEKLKNERYANFMEN